MNLRIHALKKASRQRPGVKIAAARFFQFYIIHSAQKGQASSCKMYTRGEICMEICRFLVKLQAFCRILTKPEASAIFFTDSGSKPDAQAEACFFHLCGASAPSARCACARRGGPVQALPSYFCCYRRHEGVCLWLVSRADPFFCLAKGGSFL